MYVNVYVPKSGGGVVPKSDVYKYSDPTRGDRGKAGKNAAVRCTTYRVAQLQDGKAFKYVTVIAV